MVELKRDPIYNQTAEKLKELEIEAVLFDLDDTLIYTAEIFYKQMREYAEKVSEQTGLDFDELMTVLQEINDEEYKKMGVNPNRWKAVVEKMSKRFFGFEKEIIENLEVLLEIYNIEPRIREGVKAMLDVFRESGVKMGLVTHANVDWTIYKLDILGIWDYFDSVTIVDENGHKESEDWKRAMDGLETKPDKCLIVGDSLKGDIGPGDELGTRTIYLPSPWSVYRQGKVPEKTKTITEIFELLAALDRLR